MICSVSRLQAQLMHLCGGATFTASCVLCGTKPMLVLIACYTWDGREKDSSGLIGALLRARHWPCSATLSAIPW